MKNISYSQLTPTTCRTCAIDKSVLLNKSGTGNKCMGSLPQIYTFASSLPLIIIFFWMPLAYFLGRECTRLQAKRPQTIFRKVYNLLLISAFLVFIPTTLPAMCEQIEHPIDRQEQECISQAKDLNARTVCTMKAARAWNFEVDRYYSLLYKKLPESARTTLFDDQKYWNMYKNNEYKILDSLKDAQNDTLSSVIFRSEQKRNLIKNRAQDLRMYYIQTFPDDEQEKIKTETAQDGFRLDPVLQRSLRWLGF